MLVFEVCAHFGLAQETRTRYEIMHQVRTYNFNCDFTTKGAALACKVNFAHTSNVDTAHKVVVAKAKRILPLQRRTVLLSHQFPVNSHTPSHLYSYRRISLSICQRQF